MNSKPFYAMVSAVGMVISLSGFLKTDDKAFYFGIILVVISNLFAIITPVESKEENK